MKLGIFAKTFEGTDPSLVLAAVSEAGFGAVQYNMACCGLPSMPDAVPAGIAEGVAEAARGAGVELVALSGTYNMIHPDPIQRRRGHERLGVVLAAAAAMSAPLVTLCTGTRDPEDQWRGHPGNAGPDAWNDLLRSMDVALRLADRHGIDLGIEPELANVVDSAARARRLIDELASPRLKVVIDPANLFEVEPLQRQRDIVATAIDLLADRIVMGHAKDRTASGGFTTAGDGVLDYPHYLARLKEVGFDGPLVTHGLKASEAKAVATFLRRAVAEAGIGP